MRWNDLCLAWIAERDAAFVERLDLACRARNLSVAQVTTVNLERFLEQLAAGEVGFAALFDRATDENPRFTPLVEWADRNGVVRLNPHDRCVRAADKALTHRDLFSVVQTPYTIILPPYAEAPELGEIDLSPLGPAFAIKPAHGGGGEGVIVLSTTREHIQAARRQFPRDGYLLQQRVVPTRLNERAAWFRIIHAAGHVYPCWWDTHTHVYAPVSVAEESFYGLHPLRELTLRIAEVCGLGLFSTEIALQADGIFQVVDYVNDPLDLTPQSALPSGVPDQIVLFVAENLAAWVAAQLGKRPA